MPCGLHRTYYSGIERGVRNVSLVNIEKVRKGLSPVSSRNSTLSPARGLRITSTVLRTSVFSAHPSPKW